MQLAEDASPIRATRFSKHGYTLTQKQALTAELARRHFAYDPETGLVTWRISPRYGIPVGSVAGGKIKRGYICVRFLGCNITLHRLAWLLHYGQWPERVIDHINRDKADNRIRNLRDVTQAENLANRDPDCASGPSGPRGARPRPSVEVVPSGRFRAVVTLRRKKHYFGTFDERMEADRVAREAADSF